MHQVRAFFKPYEVGKIFRVVSLGKCAIYSFFGSYIVWIMTVQTVKKMEIGPLLQKFLLFFGDFTHFDLVRKFCKREISVR